MDQDICIDHYYNEIEMEEVREKEGHPYERHVTICPLGCSPCE
jgi:hypothetical protein